MGVFVLIASVLFMLFKGSKAYVYGNHYPHNLCIDEKDCLNGYHCNDADTGDEGFCDHDKGCFPGDASIETIDGGKKLMHQLKIGDKVSIGNGLFSDVYAFGHKDLHAISKFYNVELESSSSNTSVIQISQGHFVPTVVETGILYKRACDLRPSDTLLGAVSHSSTLVLFNVTDISLVEKEGLFNPITSAGTIMANNVLASVHSDWFLDNMFNKFGIPNLLPYAYQGVLAPARFISHILGETTYTLLYEFIESATSWYGVSQLLNTIA